ncbi:hypothetical protein HOY80DRAFT_114669 [Tuber brumale]|nr:hypothetical protein HOY80DRAFT_114669 [Tuber brumale]
MVMPKQEQSAHTISQRIRMLKKVPPELIPLGVVMAAGVGNRSGDSFHGKETIHRQAIEAFPFL